MSSAIGSVAQLVKVIQHQLGARAPGTADVARAAGAAVTSGAQKRRRPADHHERYAPDQLAALITARVRQIGRDDPQRGRKAFRVFLEAVLLSHFGSGMLNDARFFQMVDDIQLAMEADAGTQALMAQAIEQLLTDK